MSRRRKISAIAILGLGVFASVATCVRMPYLKYYDVAKYPNETAYHLAVISITSNVECCLGMIACSLPPLRKLFKFYYGSSHEGDYQIAGEPFLLVRHGLMGIFQSDRGPGNSNLGIKLDSIHGQRGKFRASVQRGTTRAPDNETDDDNSSSRGIIRKTEITVSSSEFHV
ncbi:hypothetical protein ACHAPD_010650 [Fusarium lateritium]